MSFEARASEARVVQKAEVADNATTALRLRMEGVPTVEIAFQIGLSPRRTNVLISEALKASTAPAVDDWRALQLHRLENMHETLRPYLMRDIVIGRKPDGEEVIETRPDLRVADRLLRIAERQAKLLGLDMPVRLEIEKNNGPTVVDVVNFDPAVDAPQGRLAAPSGAGVDK